MTDKFENSFTKHEEFNEANNDSHVAQSVKEILQHAHRHISDAIDCDENNYGESAVRSYSLAMDYFKTYLKMAEIEKHYGTIWCRLRRRRRVPFFIFNERRLRIFLVLVIRFYILRAREWMVLVV